MSPNIQGINYTEDSSFQTFAAFCMLYVFFWVIPRRLKFICLHLPAYKDGTECSETSAYKIQMPGNYPEENIRYTEDF